MVPHNRREPSIRSRGRRGATAIPAWRIEDPLLDPHQFKIAVWLSSHADAFFSRITRNLIADRTGISRNKVTSSMARLAELGIVEVTDVEVAQSEGGHRWLVVFDHEVWETGRLPVDNALQSDEPSDPPRVTNDPGPGSRMTQGPGHERPSTKVYREKTYPTSRDVDSDRTLDPHEAPVDNKPLGWADDTDVLASQVEAIWGSWQPQRRNGRVRVQRSLRKALERAAFHEIEAGALAWMRYYERTNTEWRYIPMLTTWLNDERWETAPPEAKGRRAGWAANDILTDGPDVVGWVDDTDWAAE